MASDQINHRLALVDCDNVMIIWQYDCRNYTVATSVDDLFIVLCIYYVISCDAVRFDDALYIHFRRRLIMANLGNYTASKITNIIAILEVYILLIVKRSFVE